MKNYFVCYYIIAKNFKKEFFGERLIQANIKGAIWSSLF